MSLDFAIIPITTKFFATANDIKYKLTSSVNCQLDIQIDTDTDIKIQSRIQKWKKQDYNIVYIDEDYDESRSIIVTFSGKGSRSHPMLVDEFIDIVSSYESDSDTNDKKKDDKDENDDETKQTSEDDNRGDLCIIM